MSKFINPVVVPEAGWANLHTDSYLASQGVEKGDQLLVTVLGGVIRYNFGDTEPSKPYGYKQASQGDSFITYDGADCWVDAIGVDATLQVEYAP